MAKKRERLEEPEESNDVYGIVEGMVKTFSSGCQVLNCALGGGWARSRILNLVGDQATGKTLLAIEAAANFMREFPTGRVIYVDNEAAFDPAFAQSLGLPLEHTEIRTDLDTIEANHKYVEELLATETEPVFYILDSLDATTDEGEKSRKVGEGTYNLTKQVAMGIMFRQITTPMKESGMTMMIISQVRENIGVSWGEKYKRAGGKYLDHNASQIVWLAMGRVKKIKRTRKKVERITGVNVVAQVKKNRVGPPFRIAKFPILFNFGVEDVLAGIDWLVEVERTDEIGLSKVDAKKLAAKLDKLTDEEYAQTRTDVSAAVSQVWKEVEDGFRPSRKKY